MTDYLAHFRETDNDLQHYGIKGMQWGKRRSTTSASSPAGGATPPAGGATPPAPAGEQRQVVGAASGESSGDRYSRLRREVDKNGGNSLSEQDLKFVTGRTEALVKINKMQSADEAWLTKTAKKIVKDTAEKALADVVGSLAKRYVSGPLVDSLTKSGGKDAKSEKVGKKKKDKSTNVKNVMDAVKEAATSTSQSTSNSSGAANQFKQITDTIDLTLKDGVWQ